jgi:hypothetical protein
MADVTIEWSMKRARDRLELDYVVVNRSHQALFVADLLVVAGAPAPRAVVVVRGDRRGEVRFIKSDAPPLYSKVLARVPSGLRPLAAGERVTGTAATPWPLRETHPVYHEERALPWPVTAGVLEVEVYPGDVEQVTSMLKGGTVLNRARHTAPEPRVVRSGVLALPA